MKTVGLRYLAEFSCIGPECEASCCHDGWDITFDEKHCLALAERLTTEEMVESVRPHPNPNRQQFGLMVLRDDGGCSMHDSDGFCKIQKRFGEELLPDTCAVFPRTSGVVGGRFELSATLSCPEIARRCLLVDGATDTIEMSDDKIVRGLIYKAMRGDEDAYHASFDAVRALVMGVLSQRRVPVASRLFSVAWFAEQTRPWLHEHATTVDRDKLTKLFQIMRQPEALDRFHQQLQAANMSEPFAASVVQQVLVGSREAPVLTFVRLLDTVLALDGESDPSRLWEAHRLRAAALPAATVEKLELALEAFCRNFAYKDWYVKSPSFTRWLHGLLVRVTILRYLVVAHPLAHEAPERAIVEVAYSLSRTLEHDDRSMARILDALHTQGMQTLAHAVSLLTF